MSSLTDRLRTRIRSEGPISFHDFMSLALYDNESGYYSREHQRWGRAGDYRTSPERSVLFAATLANYFAHLYKKLGSPAQWTVVEVGAGSGEFSEGVLNSLRLRDPEVFKAITYVIDERSPAALVSIRKRLAPFGDQVSFARIADLSPISKGIIFSNELLDAFPIHRVTIRAGKLAEFFVAVDETGKFVWTVAEPSTPALERYFDDAGFQLVEGQVAEINLALREWIKLAAEKLKRGYVVTVDYGAEASELFSPAHRAAGTLRGFRQHRMADDVLADPGQQDITSTINWSDVIGIGESAGLKQIVFERQDQFLLQEGLLAELEQRVNETADESEKVRLRTSAREMILPEGMAVSFQVLVQEKP
jgi:SAM-dependent MidA family methyltransferase